MIFRLVVYAFVALAAVSLRAQNANEDFDRLMEHGRVSETDNQLLALQDYLSAAELAKRENLPEAEAEAALNAGRIVEELYGREPNRLARAFDLYQEAAKQGNSEQQQIAFNNLGVLYLKLDNIQGAIKNFHRIDFSGANASMAFLFRYNYGRALERNQEMDKAFVQYQIAANLTPSFSPAVTRSAELAPNIDAVAEFCKAILEKAPENSIDCLHHALQKFAGQDQRGSLLPLLVRAYVALRLNRDTFQKAEVSFLLDIGQRASPEVRSGLEQIREAFTADFEKKPISDSTNDFFWWREPGRDMPFSALLTTLAESDRKAGHFRQAMGRYADAWSIYRWNLRAATSYVSLSNDNGKIDDAKEFIEELIAFQFAKSNHGNDSLDDNTMLPLHIALGTALEHWRPCHSFDRTDDPQQPLFHWVRAEQAETRLRKRDPQLPLSFVLYKHLASCFRDGDAATYMEYRKNQANAFQSYRSLYRPSDKLRYHLHAIVYPAAALRIGAQAALNQWRDDPRQWGQGIEGYGRRYGSSYAVRGIRQLLAFGLDAGLGEDPHFIRLGRSGIKARTMSVLRQTVITYNNRGDYTFAVWRIGSAYGSELISNSWRPQGYNTIGDALVRSTFTIAGDAGANALKEFLPDFKRVRGLRWIASAAAWFLQ